MKENFSTYITSLDSWMKYFGFEVYGGGEGYFFDRMYHKKSNELSRFGTVDTYAIVKAEESVPSADNIKSFSAQSYDYASKIRKGPPLGFGGMLVVFPLIVLEKIPIDVYNFLKTYCPKNLAAVEFPSVLDLETGYLYYYENTPVWGGLYYSSHRKDCFKYFSLKSWEQIAASNKSD
jgi:hypothetical protein